MTSLRISSSCAIVSPSVEKVLPLSLLAVTVGAAEVRTADGSAVEREAMTESTGRVVGKDPASSSVVVGVM